MKGMTSTMDNDVLVETQVPIREVTSSESQSLADSVHESLNQYFLQLGDQTPTGLWQMVIRQVERPLIQKVLHHTGGNQSKAAKYLDISRGTLRKKMAIYDLFDK